MRRPVWLLLALLAVCGDARGASDSPAELVESFHASMARGDREAALSALAPNVAIFEAGGAELSRSEYASHHLSGDLEFARSTERTVLDRRQVVHGEVAWVLTQSETRGSFRGRDVDSRGTETMVLERAGEVWQIVHVHWSSRSVER